MKLYHSTSKENAEKILKNGFDLSKAEDCYFGKGAYFFVEKDDAIFWEDDVVLEVEINGNGFTTSDQKDFEDYIIGVGANMNEAEHFLSEGYDFLFSKEELDYFNPKTFNLEEKECEIAVVYNAECINHIKELS